MAGDGPFRGGTVISAYILIQTQVGEVGDVVRELEGVKGVAPAQAVTGPYDVIARPRPAPWTSWDGSWSGGSRPSQA